MPALPMALVDRDWNKRVRMGRRARMPSSAYLTRNSQHTYLFWQQASTSAKMGVALSCIWRWHLASCSRMHADLPVLDASWPSSTRLVDQCHDLRDTSQPNARWICAGQFRLMQGQIVDMGTIIGKAGQSGGAAGDPFTYRAERDGTVCTQNPYVREMLAGLGNPIPDGMAR